MSTRLISICSLICVIGLCGRSPVQSEEVKRSDASQFTYLLTTSDGRACTGCLIRNSGAILAPLHGVAGDRSTISAKNWKGETINGLRIIKINVAKDLALITSPEVQRLSAKEGFTLPFGTNPAELQKLTLTVIAYPAGIDLTQTDTVLRVLELPLEPLGRSINRKLRDELRLRGSPSLNTVVLRLQGELLPGSSGGGLVDVAGNLIAMADGSVVFDEPHPDFLGLPNRTALSWAIPLDSNIEWLTEDKPEFGSELDRLKKLADEIGLTGFAIGNPREMQLVLKEISVLEAPGDYLITVLRKSPAQYIPALLESASGAVEVSGIEPALSKLFFIVPSGTQVTILPRDPEDEKVTQPGLLPWVNVLPGGSHKKVRILSGEHMGEIGWVPLHFLKAKQVKGLTTKKPMEKEEADSN
jgi:hypothetical protein